jgi:hypothetical protein
LLIALGKDFFMNKSGPDLAAEHVAQELADLKELPLESKNFHARLPRRGLQVGLAQRRQGRQDSAVFEGGGFLSE